MVIGSCVLRVAWNVELREGNGVEMEEEQSKVELRVGVGVRPVSPAGRRWHF